MNLTVESGASQANVYHTSCHLEINCEYNILCVDAHGFDTNMNSN